MAAHPIHPALVHFPVALLTTATLADIARVAGFWSDVYFTALLMAFGLAGGLLAMGAGLVDFAKLDQAIVPHALRHMGAVTLAWLGYAIALYLRRDVLFDGTSVESSSVILSIASGAVLLFGGWLGGNLVYRYGAGVARSPRQDP